jgi:guanylate kinase
MKRNEDDVKRLVILTGISGSWKTCLQNELMNIYWWKAPINFTTRAPRSDDDKDEYVFLSEQQFFNKLRNWDFLEDTKGYDNYYAISRVLPDSDIVLVLDSAWREQVVKAMVWIDTHSVETYYLSLSDFQQECRLSKRGDSEEVKEKRKNDSSFITPSTSCTIINGEEPTSELAEWINNRKC